MKLVNAGEKGSFLIEMVHLVSFSITKEEISLSMTQKTMSMVLMYMASLC